MVWAGAVVAGTDAGTEYVAGCVPGQHGVLGWPVQHGADWAICPGHAGNPLVDSGRLGQRLLVCGAEPEDGGQLPQRASERWGDVGQGGDGEREGSGSSAEIRGRERVERMEETSLQLQTWQFDISKDFGIYV